MYSASTYSICPCGGLFFRDQPMNMCRRLLMCRYAHNGIVRARSTSKLSVRRAAQLVRLLAQQGQGVKAGDAVAELDTSQLSLQKTKLEDARTPADAALTRWIGDSAVKGNSWDSWRSRHFQGHPTATHKSGRHRRGWPA